MKMKLKRTLSAIAIASTLISPLSTLAEDPQDITISPDSTLEKYEDGFIVGPTGIEGWAYFEDDSTEKSRQILVKAVDPGSPADGLLQTNDVILGVSGDGAEPTEFYSDCRRAVAEAINAAEARDPASLKFIRWRANEVTTVTLTLETMGAYSSTAPYNCPKSRNILKKAVNHTFHNQGKGKMGSNILSLIAANDPSAPDNAARLEKAREWAEGLIPSDREMYEWNTFGRHRKRAPQSWFAGYHLISLAELYLVTEDETLLPAIYAYVSVISSGLNALGATGHGFAGVAMDGGEKRLLTPTYGTLNAAGMPCILGLVLAKQCGIDHPWIDDALVRSSAFFGSYAGRGAIPYGMGRAKISNHETNGKSGLAALIFSIQDGYDFQSNFFSKMAASASSQRDGGDNGPLFQQLWAPLGAAVAGEDAAALYFKQVRWKIDLSRRWDGSFTLSALDNNRHSKNASETWSGFYFSTAAILTYALPLRNLCITGRMHRPEDPINGDEYNSVVLASTYDASSRTTDQLISDLDIFSPRVKDLAGKELAKREEDDSSIIPKLTELLEDEHIEKKIGACLAMRHVHIPAEIPTLVSLLTHPESRLREAAAEAIQYTEPKSAGRAYANEILTAFLDTAKPFDPYDPDDPSQLTSRAFAALLFNGGSKLPKGILRDHLDAADRNLAFDAMRAINQSRIGPNLKYLQFVFEDLNQDDFFEVADVYVDLILNAPRIEIQNTKATRIQAINTLRDYGMAEAVPLARKFLTEGIGAESGVFEAPLQILTDFAGSVNTVAPYPEAVEIGEFLVEQNTYREKAQEFLDAVAADISPASLVSLKSISSVTADDPVLRLPNRRTTFRVDAYDHAKGDSIYTWEKIHGSGDVFITPNGTMGADMPNVLFDGTPGKYVFEVTMSDSRGLTEVSETVAITVKPSVGSLPPNEPPSATPSSWTLQRARDFPIVLQGSDPEDLGLSYHVTSNPTHGSLLGTPPSLIYRPAPDYLGADSFTFEVMDSEGQRSTAAVQLTINETNDLGLAIYEPFDYPASNLDGQSGSSEVGLTGQWEVEGEILIQNSSLSYGRLKAVGSHVLFDKGRAARSIDPSALSGNGLLDDGATLWCGFILQRSANSGRSRFGFALATNIFSGGSNSVGIKPEGSLEGSGIGIYMENGNPYTFNHAVFPARFGSGGEDRVLGLGQPHTVGQEKGIARLYILKIQWGETAEDFDVIEIYQPTQNLALPREPVMTLSTHVNQVDFDTLTMLRKSSDTLLDEIRFGHTYQSVLSGNVAMSTDLTPPSPVDFLQPPSVASPTSLTMTANASTDPSGGVAYYFSCVTGSGNDSGWQTNPTYTDTDLEPGSTYGYTVKARDLSPAANETSPSTEALVSLPDSTFIPDVTQVSRVDAESLLDYAGLRVGGVSYVRDSSLAPGTVLIQSLDVSPMASVGTEVDLVVITDDVTPLIRWTEEKGLNGLDVRVNADPDRDGLINLLEFGLGLQPLANELRATNEDGSVHGLPHLRSNQNEMEYYFIRRKDHSVPGSVAYTVQFSSDMDQFYDDSRTPTWVANMNDSDYELVKLTFPTLLPNGKSAQFARVQLAEVPPVD